jgi:hypothetical protein
MSIEQATEISNRVLAGFSYALTEPPQMIVATWQVFYRGRDGKITSAFMDDGSDIQRSAEQLETAIRSALSS